VARAADLDHDREGAELLQRLVEADAAPVDVESLLGEQPLDVEVGDRAEQATPLAGIRLDREREAFELAGQGVRRLLLVLGLDADDPFLVLEHAQVLAARLDGEPAGQEEVARVARLHADDVADLAEVRHVITKDHLHRHPGVLLYG